MGTTLKELRRKVLMGFKEVDGGDILIAEEAINLACRSIAEVQNFEEMLVYDTTSAKISVDVSRYHLVDNWFLTRPKDILSIRAMDEHNSIKLKHLTGQALDEFMPYPEGQASQTPTYYYKSGDWVEVFPIPDAALDVYVRYYQWPLVLTEDTDECSYEKIDGSVIALARDIFIALRSALPLDSVAKAKAYLSLATSNDRSAPDDRPIARGYRSGQGRYSGEPWNDPFIKQTR